MARTMTGGAGERAWSWFLSRAALPAGDVLFGQRMIRRLRFLECAQWWDRERLLATRDAAVRALVRTAYHEVPFYRDLMDGAGVAPAEIRGAADLHRIPVVTKADLLAGYPDRTTRETGFRTAEWRTSGSTGTNFRVRTDTQTVGWHRASFLLALEWAGWRMGERHLQTGMTLNRTPEKRLKDALLRCHYFSAFDLRDESLDRALDLLDRHEIRHLWGYPGSLFQLARRAAERGWSSPLRTVITWGDNLYPAFRAQMERTFGTRVTDTYGCAEGMQISAQCGEGTYHVHSLDVVVDYTDDQGNPVPAGTPGNIVLTRLHPGPMPLIRYRVGDVGIAGPEAPCPCGRGFERMASIQGRDTDHITTPDGNRLIVHFFTGILEHVTEIESFQVVQDLPDAIRLRVVPASGIGLDEEARIRSLLWEKGAQSLRIDIEVVDEIPLTAGGKRRFVINNLRPPASSGV